MGAKNTYRRSRASGPTVWAQLMYSDTLIAPSFFKVSGKGVCMGAGEANKAGSLLQVLRRGVCAGVLIAVGGCVFLLCENRYVASGLFSVALVCILYREYILFTGQVGFFIQRRSRTEAVSLLIGLFANLASVWLLGVWMRYAAGAVAQAAEALCTAKLSASAFTVFTRGFFCGVLMDCAVRLYREKNTMLGVLLCVPVFLVCGFEHSVADFFYFAAARCYTAQMLWFMLLVLLGNSAGALLLPCLTYQKTKQNKA